MPPRNGSMDGDEWVDIRTLDFAEAYTEEFGDAWLKDWPVDLAEWTELDRVNADKVYSPPSPPPPRPRPSPLFVCFKLSSFKLGIGGLRPANVYRDVCQKKRRVRDLCSCVVWHVLCVLCSVSSD